ncbi:MAG TPA: peptidylprolyl isomerase [Gemmatimonadaceae bacterium]|nr:peptidylprolyl isomerase [Gemmatimonadaceae bacterium]
MKLIFRALLLMAALTSSVAAQDSTIAVAPPPAPSNGDGIVDRVVAVVGTTPILLSDVMEQVNALRAANREIPTDSAGRAAMMREIVERLVDEELLLARAKVESVTVEDSDVSAPVDQQVSRVRGQFVNEAEFRTALRRSGFGTPDEYRRWLLDQQRRQALQQKLFEKLRSGGKLPPAPVTEKQVEEYFAQNSNRIPQLPPTVTFRQIIVAPKPTEAAKSAAYAKAESLYVEITKGADFESVARRESMDPASKEIGGDLGWQRRGQFVRNFEQVVFNIRPNVVTPPFETPFGWHIARVDRIQPTGGERKVRHILIRPKIDSTDVAAAQKEAQDVADALRAGADFDSLATRHHDPGEERSTGAPFPVSQLPESYQKALEGKKAGEVTDAFRIEDQRRGMPKYVVVSITARSEARQASANDFREQIRQQLAQEGGIRRLLDQMRKQTFVSIRL